MWEGEHLEEDNGRYGLISKIYCVGSFGVSLGYKSLRLSLGVDKNFSALPGREGEGRVCVSVCLLPFLCLQLKIIHMSKWHTWNRIF